MVTTARLSNSMTNGKPSKFNPWWMSPVWEVETGLQKTFNDSLLAEIHSIGVSIKNGKNTEKDSLWSYNLPHLNFLKATIEEAVQIHIINNIPEAKALRIRSESTFAWVNVVEPNDTIEAHAHNDSSVAVTYYVRTPKDCGDIVLLDTSGAINSDGYFNGNQTFTKRRFTPKAGKLVMFPSYMVHEVEQNKSDKLRISISTDIQQVTDRDAPNALILKSWCDSMLKIKEWGECV